MKKIVSTYLLLLSALFIAPAAIAQTISINTVSLSGKIYRGIDNPIEITCDSCPEDVSFSLTAENAEVVQDDSVKTKYTVTTYWKQDLEDDVILTVYADIGLDSKSVTKKFDLVAIHDPVSEVKVSGHTLYEQDTCMVLTKKEFYKGDFKVQIHAFLDPDDIFCMRKLVKIKGFTLSICDSDVTPDDIEFITFYSDTERLTKEMEKEIKNHDGAMYAMVHNVLIELPDGSIRSLPKTICIYTLSL